MSVQFGKCNFDGKPVDPEDLAEVRPVLAPYGPDGEGYICKDNLAVLYRAFHTTKESRREVQPHLCPSGAVITWDGRLDNREELIGRLTRETSATSTDLEIVAASYERWGNGFVRQVDRRLGAIDLGSQYTISASRQRFCGHASSLLRGGKGRGHMVHNS